MATLQGVIPAAGRGTRAYPYTHNTPKGMLRINGVPNIERNLTIMRDALGIRDICIVIGPFGDQIQGHFGDGSQLGVRIRYVHNDAIERGLAYSVLLARRYVDDYFCVMLSDECYIDTNHGALATFPYRDALATCGVLEVDDDDVIRRNYSVELEGDRVTRLIEKPTAIPNRLLGTGTFVFHPRLFTILEEAFAQVGEGGVDLVGELGRLCAEGERIRHFRIEGTYVNINDRDSLQLAKYHTRQKLLESVDVSLLIYSEGDETDINLTIAQYRRQGRIHRLAVVVPHDNSVTALIADSGVRVIRCPPRLTRYGEKLRYALAQLPGDVIMLTDANYSYPARDVAKLLAYLPDADMVIGTRTTRQLISRGSQMRGIVRLANIILAKLMELLWWRFDCRFTDVGCTLRAVWRSSLDMIQSNLVATGPEFSAEMMIELLEARERIIEVPVHYMPRSYSMYRKYQNFHTFWGMLWLMLGRRLRGVYRRRPHGANS